MAIRKELLEELNERRAAVSLGGGADKLAKRHQKGQLGARERIEGLYDKDSFQESGGHVNHQTAEMWHRLLCRFCCCLGQHRCRIQPGWASPPG